MSHPAIVDLTNENFSAEVEQALVPVVIDFWSEHCGPCKMLAPLLDQVAGEVEGLAKVTKADIECSNGVIHVIDSVLLPK